MKNPFSNGIYRRNELVLEMPNFTPAYVNGWTYARSRNVRTQSQMSLNA